MKGRKMTGPGDTTTIFPTGSRASGLLVPIITAVLVLALGCLLVGLTGDSSSEDDAATKPTTTSRMAW